ncbi:MAG: Mth938-like domain-containing protein [Candidatus Kinetoplastibacterium crithidii]|nr:MAG: Mth938-like domain-containing protein [Candidatus Kinetoplastibacterium crithidii]
MKLHLENMESVNIIDSYGNGFITVNKEKYIGSIFFGKIGNIQNWEVGKYSDITSEKIMLLLYNFYNDVAKQGKLEIERKRYLPEFLLIGTGNSYEVIDNDALLPLYKKGIGVEIMNTRSAIYTYNMSILNNREVIFAAIPMSDDI